MKHHLINYFATTSFPILPSLPSLRLKTCFSKCNQVSNNTIISSILYICYESLHMLLDSENVDFMFNKIHTELMSTKVLNCRLHLLMRPQYCENGCYYNGITHNHDENLNHRIKTHQNGVAATI